MASQKKKKSAPKEKRAIMHRTQKWPLTLTSEQESLLYSISDGLREYYNLALDWQKEQYEAFKEAEKAAPGQVAVKRFLTAFDCYTRFKDIQRPTDEADGLFRAQIPTNWVLETFRQAEGAYKSFFELVKKKDKDARPPRACPPTRFQVISGALSKSFCLKDGMIQLAPLAFDGKLCFPVNDYQAEQLKQALRFAKFTIARSESYLGRPGHLTMSLAYEIELPSVSDFDPETAVYVALGASSIGVVSPYGVEVIPLRRSDGAIKPHLEQLENRSKQLLETGQLTKRSGKHFDQKTAWRDLFHHLGEQQKINRRRVASRELLRTEEVVPLSKRERRFNRRRGQELTTTKVVTRGHGLHFVVTELVVRSKPGKLADASKPERSGSHGANYAAQNTGSLAHLVAWLAEKAKEQGGTVRRLALSGIELPEGATSDEQKIFVAQALRDQFLKAPEKATVL